MWLTATSTQAYGKGVKYRSVKRFIIQARDRRHDTQQNDLQHNNTEEDIKITILSIMAPSTALSIMTLIMTTLCIATLNTDCYLLRVVHANCHSLF